MDDSRLYKYYRVSGYGLNSLVRNADRFGLLQLPQGLQVFTNHASFQIYRFLIADYNLRRFFNLSAYYGPVTFVTFVFIMIMTVCSIASLNTVTMNDILFCELLEKAEKKLPRMESVVSIIPPYKCIHKHLQRMGVFQEKIKKMLRKEQLELEIMNSKMSCIEKLLKPEVKSEWRRSRSPKIYHRPINVETSK
ncbi:uncharacterized protein LOC105432630 [Pogonomyrmex barbatus]|uniref:Uncharacterized protein LOC105432630 n=1 Tax=Pogonomyrmex barbatus TaxID=144034 RepID=A0A6I9WRI0_9HYME|nr:uncharacterized protein LOC105432630 [Pogonomyrmex barbatus]